MNEWMNENTKLKYFRAQILQKNGRYQGYRNDSDLTKMGLHEFMVGCQLKFWLVGSVGVQR